MFYDHVAFDCVDFTLEIVSHLGFHTILASCSLSPVSQPVLFFN